MIERHFTENLDPDLVADKYVKLDKLGEGTYAVVYKGQDRSTNQLVAIKKIKLGQFKDGLDMSAIREIKFLRELEHEHIIQLLDVYASVKSKNINLVLEYLESDLELIIKDKRLVFMTSDIKSWMVMTLRGLEHIHRCWMLHRDLKPNNLLISPGTGLLKIADFGLARFYGDPPAADNPMTIQVVTRWYRSPELLFGAKQYGSAVDMWSVGCIFAELMLRTPFLAGESDIGQLNVIFQALGTPIEKDWPGMKQLPDYIEYTEYQKTPLKRIFTAAPNSALDLLSQMLHFDPNKRITAKQALEHVYFSEMPHPTVPDKLPRISTADAQMAEIMKVEDQQKLMDIPKLKLKVKPPAPKKQRTTAVKK